MCTTFMLGAHGDRKSSSERSCESPRGCWEPSPGPLQEQPLLLTAEPAFQARFLILLVARSLAEKIVLSCQRVYGVRSKEPSCLACRGELSTPLGCDDCSLGTDLGAPSSQPPPCSGFLLHFSLCCSHTLWSQISPAVFFFFLIVAAF